MLRRTTFREIRSSLGRYIAILAIVALGVGFFSGLKVTREAMICTVDDYLTDHRFFDFQVLNTLGYEEEDVAALARTEGVAAAEGGVSVDVLFHMEGEETDRVLKLHTLPKTVNTPELVSGRMPRAADECVVDDSLFGADAIGKTIQISRQNDADTLDMLTGDTYTITGTVLSPLYLNFERGSTTLGNGTVAGFAYLDPSGFDTDLYTEIYVRLTGGGQMYSDAHNTLMDRAEPTIRAAAEAQADRRYQSIVSDARAELADGRTALEEAEAELADGKDQLADGRAALADGRAKLDEGRADYEREKSRYEAEKQDTQQKLADSRRALTEAERQITSRRADLTAQRTTLQGNLEQVKAGLAAVARQRQEFEAAKPYLSPEEIAATEARLRETEQTLNAQKTQLEDGLEQIEAGLTELDTAAAALPDQWAAYRAAEAEAEDGFAEAEAALARAAQELEDGEAELADAEQDVRDAEAKVADGEAEIADGKAELVEGEDDLAALKAPDTYVLDRNTNIGYACFENDASIVEGIARIFPVFFFLIAALVCMTTMTRMVEDRRTQIGVLKALGFRNTAVAGIFLFYAGSAALVGCVLGFFGGCWLFPQAIWKAYHMMYDFCDALQYIIDWPLGGLALAVSLLCSMGTTLLACGQEFRAVPAEMIRPKAPKNGKRILLERIPAVWRRLSFLYKVTFRNIFRYKKRFFMMVLGISGCTALLVTGLGIRDSVQNVVNDQFDQIQVYDYGVTFDRALSETGRRTFLRQAGDAVEAVCFLHQSSADLVAGNSVKSVNLIAVDDPSFSDFVRLIDRKGRLLPSPAEGEAVVCRKLAEDYDLRTGGRVTLRNADGAEMTLTVSGICENYVYNYVYVHPASCAAQWGSRPEIKSALVHAAVPADSADPETAVHASAAKIQDLSRVAAVSVNADMRNRVNNMMKSLDYVVLLVIAAAGALAFIVLYHLTNINITERMREIATIKVLGFYPGETSAYVFRENLFLTVLSGFLGLGVGKWLHWYVMDNIRIDLLHFDVQISGLSYVLALALTFVFALLVQMVMYRKLNAISMTESLKSVE